MRGGCYGSSLLRWLAQSAGEGTPVGKDGGERKKRESKFKKKEMSLVERVSRLIWHFTVVSVGMEFHTKSDILNQQWTN